MNTILRNVVGVCLTLFISASAQGIVLDTYTTLEVPGATSTEADGIDGNNIVGRYRGNGANRGFSYDGTTYSTFVYPGGGSTYAYGIDGDYIVGGWTGGGDIGFIYDEDASTYTALHVPGARWTEAHGIQHYNPMDGSNQFYIVGGYTEDDPSNRTHGFLYDGTTYTTIDVPGAQSTYIHGIDGNNIVGRYHYGGGSFQGFIATIPEPPRVIPGDFNRDEAVDATDIDLLREAIHANDTSPHFDVNEDSFVNSTDLDYLVEAILGTVHGDGDLNKIVNFQDFALLSTNFSAIDSGWAQGNYNMDSRTDFMDFVHLANNYGIDLSSGVSAQETVPEPASLVLLSLAFSFVAKRRA